MGEKPIKPVEWTFDYGARVEKVSGSSWRGKVVGFYSTDLTPEGYAVESDTETGSVQIYPLKALRAATPRGEDARLREALEEIVRLNQVQTWTATEEKPETHWEAGDGQYARIARAALQADAAHTSQEKGNG